MRVDDRLECKSIIISPAITDSETCYMATDSTRVQLALDSWIIVRQYLDFCWILKWSRLTH